MTDVDVLALSLDAANARAERWKARCEEARATIARIETLVRATEWRAASSLSRDVTGQPFPESVPLDHLRAALRGPR